MEDAVTGRSRFIQTVVGALTLRDDAFRAAGDAPHPFRRGLVFVVAIGLIVALAGVVGALLTWWTSPDMAAIQKAVVDGVVNMPWRQQVPPDQVPMIDQAMHQNMAVAWGIIDALMPSVPKALANVVFLPLTLVVSWLVIGLLLFAGARLLSGNGSLAQTYGATALAQAPYLLGVVHVLPYVQAAGLGTWSLICTYLAIKNSHNLSPGRAFWATVFPPAVLAVFALIVGIGVAAAVAMIAGGMGR
jgi:hypothetical protein